MMKLFLSILLTALFALPVSGSDTNTVVVAADSWPPFVDPGGQSQGLSLEIIRAAYKTQGYTVEYKNVPWARAEAGVESGIYDILPDVWMTETRKKALFFSKPYASNDIKFISLKGDPFEFDGLNSLRGKQVGVIRGYGYSEEFNRSDEFKKEPVPDFMLNLKKLVTHRIDLTLEDEIVARHRIAKEAPGMFDKVRFSQKSLSRKGLYIASGYKNPRHQEIIAAFNKGLEAIQANGTFAEIMKNYSLVVTD